MLVLNAVKSCMWTPNNFFFPQKHYPTRNLHRHRGLRLLDHQLKRTLLQCWIFHLGAYKWTLSHHLRIFQVDQLPSFHWWWTALIDSARLYRTGRETQRHWSKEITFLYWNPIRFPSVCYTATYSLTLGKNCVIVEKNSYINSCAKKGKLRKLCLTAHMTDRKIRQLGNVFQQFFIGCHTSLSASQWHAFWDAKKVVFLTFLSVEPSILWTRHNKTQKQIQKTTTLHNAEESNNQLV